eukprot:SM000188S03800  [mRNA]  locus=s188:70160:70676:+ [translate_table: standard]
MPAPSPPLLLRSAPRLLGPSRWKTSARCARRRRRWHCGLGSSTRRMRQSCAAPRRCSASTSSRSRQRCRSSTCSFPRRPATRAASGCSQLRRPTWGPCGLFPQRCLLTGARWSHISRPSGQEVGAVVL